MVEIEPARQLECGVGRVEAPEALHGKGADLLSLMAEGRQIDSALLVPEVERVQPASCDGVPTEGMVLDFYGSMLPDDLMESLQDIL